jgi:hypothetical protein
MTPKPGPRVRESWSRLSRVGYEKQRIRLFSRSDRGGPGTHHEEYRLGFRSLDSTRERVSYISSTRATRQKRPERLAWDGNTELSATRLVPKPCTIFRQQLLLAKPI